MEYNFNKPSKKLLETSKRIDRQTDEYLKNYYTKLKEDEERVSRELYEKSMSAARFSAASAYARNKQRVMNMTETLKYNNTASLIGMTEIISQIVEESLLFDTKEYAKTNPNYKQEIRESVRDILENGNILEDIRNRDTLIIMEHIAKTIPDIKTGLTLTEDEISAFMSKESPIAIESAISRLSSNVKSRVANLVEKEQTRLKKVKKEMPKNKEADLDTEDIHTADLDDVPADEIMDQDQDGNVDQLENPEEDAAVAPEEEVSDEVEAEAVPEEEMPAEEVSGPTPVKQININPDGTLQVNIFEGTFETDLDEEIECILDDGYLTEKFNQNKFVDKTINHEYTKNAKKLGSVTGFFFGGLIGVLIGRLIGKTVSSTEFSEEIDALEKAVRKDSDAMRIIADIKEAYNNKDISAMKDLKKEFTIKVRDIKKRIKEYGTKSIEEAVDNMIKSDISKTRLFYRDIPRSGLIESLAVNAAQNMIAEHGVYNRDIAFANALTYVTIVETFAETGLLNVDNVAYNTITQQAGGKVVH